MEKYLVFMFHFLYRKDFIFLRMKHTKFQIDPEFDSVAIFNFLGFYDRNKLFDKNGNLKSNYADRDCGVRMTQVTVSHD